MRATVTRAAIALRTRSRGKRRGLCLLTYAIPRDQPRLRQFHLQFMSSGLKSKDHESNATRPQPSCCFQGHNKKAPGSAGGLSLEVHFAFVIILAGAGGASGPQSLNDNLVNTLQPLKSSFV